MTALPAAASDPLLSGVGTAVAVQYHRDAITRLPDGAVPLLTGTRYPHQAYRLGRAAWAVQFHPEATPEIFAAWTSGSGLADERELNDAVRTAAAEMAATWRPMTEAFARIVTERARTAESDVARIVQETARTADPV